MSLELEDRVMGKDIVARFKKFLWDYRDKKTSVFKYRERLSQMALMNQRSLLIDFNDLTLYDRKLAHLVELEPDKALEAASIAIKDLVSKEYPDYAESVEKFYPRFRNPTHVLRIRELTSEYIGRLVAIEGIVTRLTRVEARLVKAMYRHNDPKCGAEFYYPEHGEMGERIEKPPYCPICGRPGKFELVIEKSQFIDWQKIVVQEKPEEIPPGQIPRNIEVVLKSDLVDTARPGDRVTVIGVLRVMPTASAQRGVGRSVFSFYIDANYVDVQQKVLEEVEITREDEEKIRELARDPWIREKIIASIAPAIYGHWNIKEAIALLLFGGVPKILPDGTRIRGDIHVLLVGDPGTAKSQLLQYTARIAPRGIYTSGKGSTAAGLTATVLRDKTTGEYYLEAGAMVLADGGVACLHPDTRVIVNNEYIRIRELFRENETVKAFSNNEPIELNYIEDKVIGINLDNLTSEETVSTIIRRKYWKGKIIKLVFESGYELLVTPDHLLIDGENLEWKQAMEFKPGDKVLSIQKIPSHNSDMYILDIIPDEWTAVLEGREKEEFIKMINGSRDILFNIAKRFNKKFYKAHDKLYINVGLFKYILKQVKKYSEWRAKGVKYSRKNRSETLLIDKVTPELGYLMGFIHGDGYIVLNNRRGFIQITQSLKHKEMIDKIIDYVVKITGKKPHIRIRHTASIIGDRKVISDDVVISIYSVLFTYIVNYFLEDGLKRILKLPDNVLKAFIAGLIDSDGSISIKRSRKGGEEYVTIHIDIILSNLEQAKIIPLILRRFDIYSRIKKTENSIKIQVTGRESVSKLIEIIKPYSIKARNINVPSRKKNISPKEDMIPKKLSIKIARELMNSSRPYSLVKKGVWSILYEASLGKRVLTREWLKYVVDNVFENKVPMNIKKELAIALNKDYYLDRIVRIEYIDYEGPVYDLYVPGLHNFLAEGIIVHNCIDEIDKMREEDRSAIHEALEQQTVSIAKAGIVARLNARAAVLAAGNPKYGRYDLTQPISKNIDLPPTILSRFDLIFVIQDIPDKNRDRLLARHILGVHMDIEKAKPIIDAQLLKKYISYARRYVKPRLTEDAKKLIEEFYVNLRSIGLAAEEKGKPPAITLTPRQLEALIRLAEAHARMALKNKATIEDAEEAIRLTFYTLKRVGYDIESETFDIDLVELGISRSKQLRVRDFIRFIEELFEEYGELTYTDIVEKAGEKGFEKQFVMEMLRKLKRDGVIYERRPGVLMKV